jgi:hypothetical protein
MDSQFLESIKQRELEITGGTCEVPILYRDVFSVAGIFMAPTLALKNLLPTSKLQPLELFPGKGLLGFLAFDYRDTSIGPYREVAMAIPVRYGTGFRAPLYPALRMSFSFSFEAYIWQLPLTSQVGLNAGIDIWGFPKFMAEIDISEGEKSVTCTLSEEGRHILTLEVKKNAAKMKSYFDYTLYSVRGEDLLRTRVDGLSGSLGRSFLPGAASLELGDHSLSRKIREVAPGKSVLTLYMPAGQMILPEAGERLAL